MQVTGRNVHREAADFDGRISLQSLFVGKIFLTEPVEFGFIFKLGQGYLVGSQAEISQYFALPVLHNKSFC